MTPESAAEAASGERSMFVADLISPKLPNKRTALEDAGEKANILRSITKDMKAWEALNNHED